MAFNFGASPSVKFLQIDKFLGVDFANNPAAVSNSRSPEAVNIISDLAGKPVKRPGYKTVENFDSQINGIHRIVTQGDDGENIEHILVHAGTNLYLWDMWNEEKELLRSTMANDRSTSFQYNKRLWILDGKEYLCFGEFDDEWQIKPVTEIAYTPTVVIGRKPDGTGGAMKEDTNILSDARKYSFYGTTTDTAYHLSSTDDVKLKSNPVTARVLNDNAEWVDKVETTDFTVDRTKGIITFNTAPGKSPSSLDNVEITVYAEGADEENDKKDIINGCTIFAHYNNLIFFSGNEKARNYHYWTAGSDEFEACDPSYIPGGNYQWIGTDATAIMGYSQLGGYLAVHKEPNEQDDSIFLVSAQSDGFGGYVFPITGTAAGIGAIAKHTFSTLGAEPLYLTHEGVCAVTIQDYTARRYAQNRSYYIDMKLLDEPDLANAVAINHKSRYYLAVNDHVYVADGRQKGYQKNAPLSEFQYEWYYLDNVPARVWWEYDDHLYFGDIWGNIRMIWNEADRSATNRIYNDDGRAIEAYWDTPIHTFNTISQYKTMKGMWVMCAPYVRSSVEVYYRAKGNMQMVKNTNIDMFSFEDVDFNRFTFNTDNFPRIIATNSKLKKFVAAQFRFRNAVLNEPFSFYEAEVQYTIGGRYKG